MASWGLQYITCAIILMYFINNVVSPDHGSESFAFFSNDTKALYGF